VRAGGLACRALCGARKWLHLQDFEVDLAFQMGLLRGKLLQRLVLRMERAVLRRFDSVSVHFQPDGRAACKQGHRGDTDAYSRTGLISPYKPSLSGAKYRAQLGNTYKVSGRLVFRLVGGKQGLMIIPAVARLLAERRDIVSWSAATES